MALPKEVDSAVVAFYEELLKDGEVSEEETKLLEGILGKEKNWKKFKAGVNARSLTDREIDKLKKERETLETKTNAELANLQSLRETLATADGATKTELSQLKTAIKANEQRLFNVIQKAKEYSGGEDFLKEVGLTEGVVSSFTPQVREEPVKPQEPVFDKKALMEDFFREVSPMRDILANLPFDLVKMRDEYRSLTGRDLDIDEFRTKIFSDKDRNYQTIYEQDYDIPKLRVQKQRESMKAEIEKEYQDKFESWKSTALLPSEQKTLATSDFSKAIESTRPQGEVPDPRTNDNAVIAEAAQMFDKLVAKRDAA